MTTPDTALHDLYGAEDNNYTYEQAKSSADSADIDVLRNEIVKNKCADWYFNLERTCDTAILPAVIELCESKRQSDQN